MELAIIGGGPAGLKCAEVVAMQGIKPRLYDAMPSVGRKLLVAGKGGLNLTHSEPMDRFAKRYGGGASSEYWTSCLSDFDNNSLRAWALDLGIETFVGTSGRVFPKEFKAAPLLRRWVERLSADGVSFHMKHQLIGLKKKHDRFHLLFHTPEGIVESIADAVILALGGASWPVTGSTGEWVSLLQGMGIEVTNLVPANCGWEANWNSDIIESIEGCPLKNITVSAGDKSIAGELLITRYGLEGGALYQLGPTLRNLKDPGLMIDLKPSFNAQELADKIPNYQGNLIDVCISKWRLGKAASSLLKAFASSETHATPLSLAHALKSLHIPLIGPRPIAEAISTAGGVSFSELDDQLMIRGIPGLFVAGEMIDWEAPTGGYLLQGCFATGKRAALGACQYLGFKG